MCTKEQVSHVEFFLLFSHWSLTFLTYLLWSWSLVPIVVATIQYNYYTCNDTTLLIPWNRNTTRRVFWYLYHVSTLSVVCLELTPWSRCMNGVMIIPVFFVISRVFDSVDSFQNSLYSIQLYHRTYPRTSSFSYNLTFDSFRVILSPKTIIITESPVRTIECGSQTLVRPFVSFSTRDGFLFFV